MLKIAIIAGEASGDMLASNLISQLKASCNTDIKFLGVGGDKMKAEGFVSAFDMSMLSVGGYGIDVIMSIPKIYLLYRKITKQIIEFMPNVFIGVDAPDFNFHVEKKLKAHGIKTVHYISPTIWAWRYSRIYKIKKITDLMLCIFPMEEQMYRQKDIKAVFVGHPLANKIELDIDTNYYKRKLKLEDKVITVLVGSRIREVKSFAKTFIEACNLINQVEEATFVFTFTKIELLEKFKLNSSIIKFKYKILLNQTLDAIKAADIVLAKSGTVSLEAALCKKPLVIAYRVSKLTAVILKRRLKIPYVGQPNILLGEMVAPELIQQNMSSESIANEIIKIIKNPIIAKYMINKFYQLHQSLRLKNNNIASKSILKLINNE